MDGRGCVFTALILWVLAALCVATPLIGQFGVAFHEAVVVYLWRIAGLLVTIGLFFFLVGMAVYIAHRCTDVVQQYLSTRRRSRRTF
jgi:hypothetical protein